TVSFQLPKDNVYSGDARLAFSRRGNLLAVPGGTDNLVHIWDVDRRAEVAVLKGHQSPILESCFSPDDSWVATTGFDRTVRIWKVPSALTSDGKPGGEWTQLQVLEGHGDTIHSVAVSRDGKWLASSSSDGSVRIWDTATWKEVALPPKHG